MVFCITMQFNPLLGEGLQLMGLVDKPVGPFECTFEGPSSSSACIYDPGRGCPSFYYGPPRDKVPPWSVPPVEVPNISVGRSPIATWGHGEWSGGGQMLLVGLLTPIAIYLQ